MAKSKYNQTFPGLAKQYARDGLTDEQIAAKLGIHKDTFYEYKKRYTDFSDALKEGKEVVDAQVESSLLKRALGYEYEETEIVVSQSGKETKRVKKTKKQVPPDVTACIFWLKNRQPDKWRDKQEHEHSGSKGGPIEIAIEDLQERFQNACGSKERADKG